MRKPLATLAFVSIAVLLLAVWFAARSSDDAVPAPRPNAPRSSAPAPAVEPPQPDAPRDAAPPAPRVEVEAAAAAPQAAPSEAPVAPSTLAELRGRFLLPDGRPASGVALRVRGWEANSGRVMKHSRPREWVNPQATTDSDGRFSICFDPPLAYQFTLDATLAGHAEVSWRWSSLPPREVTDVGEITLQLAGRVRGRVVDTRGAAVAGDWHVYGEMLIGDHGEGRDATRISAQADPVTGEFVLEGLPPGPAQLKLYSRIANWIDGPRVELRAGEELTADIVYDGPDNSRRIVVVTFHKPFHVFSNPVSGSIVLHGAGEERVAKKLAGSSQSWSFEDLEPGAYDIEIRDPLFEPWRQSGVRTGTSVNAQLRANGAVQLTVVGADRSMIEDYRLRLSFPQETSTPDGMNFTFSPNEFELRAAGAPRPEGGVWRGMIPAGVAMDSPFAHMEGFEGRKLDRVSPRAFVLHVDAPGQGTGQARVEGLGVGETRLVIVQLTNPAAIAGRITGVSADSRDDISIVLVDERVGIDGATEFVEGVDGMFEDLYFRSETHTDTQGRFSFTRLQPGDYTLVARFHHDFTVAREGLSLKSGETLEIELDAGSFGAIEGRVLAHTGDLENAWVEALGAGFYDPFAGGWSTFDGEAPPRARVDAQGRFHVSPLRPAIYGLSLHHSPTPLGRDRKQWHSRFTAGLPLGAVTIMGPHVAKVEFDHMQRRRGVIHCTAIVDGQPAIGWRVEARFESADSVANSRATHAITGPDGVAHLELLEPGAWRVGLVEGERKWSSWIAPPRELAPGGELTLQLDVALHSARVLVLDAQTGQPRAKQSVRWGNGGGSAKLTTDANGELELALPVGSYTASRNRDQATVEWTASGPVPAEIKL